MYYYLKYRTQTSSKMKVYRKKGKVVVYGKDSLVKPIKKELEEKGMHGVKILSSKYSPAQRDCPIHGVRYEKVGW